MASFRDSAGNVHDLVLLDQINEDAILNALAKRFNNNSIYTRIGSVLLSVNPYKNISSLYGNSVMKKYPSKKDYQNAPHPYAIAENAFRQMTIKSENQAIVITGESGSGKTEASKIVMNYISFLASKSKEVKKVKEQLLETNPLLESFGNARTRRNDNSSRFGKLFEIQFKFQDPVGGRIQQFLLEKQRVTHQSEGERNFHIFYQVLQDSRLSSKLQLTGRPSDYEYISDPSSSKVKTIDDSETWSETLQAMQWTGMSSGDQDSIFEIIGAILHLGNIDFQSAGRDKSNVGNQDALRKAANLLGVQDRDLGIALTHRTVKSGIESVRTGLSVEKAKFARDSLAENLYGFLFKWIVKRANETIHSDQFSTAIKILDIYGFEILGVNSFEQLCINHTNERLHQLFIELTLRKEQEEYRKEGIAWSKIDFVDNLPLCNLIEKRGGLYSLIDEESIFPNGSDQSLVKKLNSNIRDRSFMLDRSDPMQFVVKHYAGKVTYTAKGMLDSNKDTLFSDLVLVCLHAQNPIVADLFRDHPAADTTRKTNKRPTTVATQYKKQVVALMDTLKACGGQHYIRCIKPNDQKRAGIFQNDLVLEQVRYLGLLENVKVRKAGYAFRMDFDEFVSTYKVAVKGHPEFEPDARKGVQRIMSSVGSKNYQMGKTKIFIKDAKDLLSVEDARLEFIEYARGLMPVEDGLIFADKVLGLSPKRGFSRTQLIFAIGGNGFYWFASDGSNIEHFVPMGKVDFLAYNDRDGWMTTCSVYPGKLPEDPSVQLSYLSENLYASDILKFVEILKTNMGYDIEVTKSSTIPADAKDPAQYKANLKAIQKGAMGVPQIGDGGKKAKACCTIQ